ncbi:flavin reductase family protein [Fusobacterium varium]|jgi:flavin reductase (DIM6/NTAB) family NADH-FMN oxidoreductase RutF|uniref:flavin reductase family protein n=1 Tax=Fusobacterium varium TaxID=856 RepID=UPI0024331272|nr:flavin reductase [Fusobacterium varium]MCF0169104.1 flavin reductase [Fusobacterium varium]
MKNFKEIKVGEINENTFEMIGKKWMLVTAEKKSGEVNTMTASWGGLGVLWRKNVAFIFIRPQRFTKGFVDEAEKFSLTFFDESYRKQLSYLGTASGKDENKIEKAKLTVEHENGAPIFKEAETVIICRKLYAQPLEEQFFIDKDSDKECYPDKDYHVMYVGEIEKVLVKE